MHIVFGFRKPAPDPEDVDQEKNSILDDQRGLALQPAIDHPGEGAMMKIINPATMSRAFQLAATSAAAMTVITAADFSASSLVHHFSFKKKTARRGGRPNCSYVVWRLRRPSDLRCPAPWR